MNCPHCAGEIPDWAAVCGYCGTPTGQPPSPPPAGLPSSPIELSRSPATPQPGSWDRAVALAATAGVVQPTRRVRWGLVAGITAVVLLGAAGAAAFLVFGEKPPVFAHACDVLDDATLADLVGPGRHATRVPGDTESLFGGVTRCDIGFVDDPLDLEVYLLTLPDARANLAEFQTDCRGLEDSHDLLSAIFDCAVSVDSVPLDLPDGAAGSYSRRFDTDLDLAVVTRDYLLGLWRDTQPDGEDPADIARLLVDRLR